MRLSREKLSFLVDCTSAPIAGLMPISTWIAYELQQIGTNLDAIGYTDESAYNLFLDSISKRFYAWFMLTMVLGSIFIGRDFGPMYTAELRARSGKGVAPADANLDDDTDHLAAGVPPKKGVPQRWWNAFLPFAGLVGAFIPLLFYSGARQAPWGGVGWGASSRGIIGNADSYPRQRRNIPSRRDPVSTFGASAECPRRGRGVAAIRLRGRPPRDNT